MGQAHFTGTPTAHFPLFATFLEVKSGIIEPHFYVLPSNGTIYTLSPYVIGIGVIKPSIGFFY